MSSNPNKPSVCRRLFDEPARSDVEEALLDNATNAHMEHMERQYLAQQSKWNFNFKTETPLEGDWEWEKVEPEMEQVEPGERLQRLQEELGKVQSAEEENHSL